MSPQYPQDWGPNRESPFRAQEPRADTAAHWPQSQAPVEPPLPPVPPPPPPRSPLPLIAVSVAVGGLLVVGAALGVTLYGKSRAGDTAATTVTAPADDGGIPKTTTTTETMTVTPTLPPVAPPAGAGGPRIPGTDAQGFMNGTARCNVDDPAVFIGRTERSSVVVCQSEATGGLYYIGYAGGMRSKDVSWPLMRGSMYVFRAGTTTYVVGPTTLTIVTPSKTVVEPWLQQWRD